MLNKTFTDKVRKLIADNNQSDALDLLRDLLGDCPQLKHLLVQQPRFAEVLEQNSSDLLKSNVDTREKQRFMAGLLDVLSEIDKQQGENPSIKAEVDHFIAHFNESDLLDNERRLLSAFAVLPAENLSYQLLINLLKPEPLDSLEGPLSILEQKGFIQRQSDARVYSMRAATQASIKAKNKNNLFFDCLTLTNNLKSQFEYIQTFNENFDNQILYLPYAESVVVAFDKPHFSVALLSYFVGIFHERTLNLDKALVSYEKSYTQLKSLYERTPTDITIKNAYAAAYQKLGTTHHSLVNLDRALACNQNSTVLFQEIFGAYPKHTDFKNNVAISFEKLGTTHFALGNYQEAYKFFDIFNKVFIELQADFPENINYKNQLALSFEKLGETLKTTGNLDSALTAYESFTKLSQAMYQSEPTNLECKNAWAVSHARLGEVHQSLGNFDKALSHFKEYNELSEEMYAQFPKNLEVKNGLNASYGKLAGIKHVAGDIPTSFIYFQKQLKLSEELYRDLPNNPLIRLNYALCLKSLGQITVHTEGLEHGKTYFKQAHKLFSELYAQTQTQKYYSEMKQTEAFLQVNGVWFGITKLITKIPFLKKKAMQASDAAVKSMSKDFKGTSQNSDLI